MSRSTLAVLLGAAFTLGAAAPAAQAIEQPRFRVEQVLVADSIEVRRYEPYIVAEVVVPGPAEQAGNQGFSFLGGYIFGRNKGDRKIAMTAPVTQSAQPVKIEMTAPVTQNAVAGGKGGFAVQFMMPSSFTMETLPEPLDPRVTLKPVAEQRVVAITYSGTWTQSNYEEHLQKLRDTAQRQGLQVDGEPVYARYNGPWVPWFMRKNEIWLPIR
ncbi:MAG: SOUL family heme-binding protein [Burkholderiaceae bacterium]|jgi:hypothetical protein